jgi:hypothetical protein
MAAAAAAENLSARGVEQDQSKGVRSFSAKVNDVAPLISSMLKLIS